MGPEPPFNGAHLRQGRPVRFWKRPKAQCQPHLCKVMSERTVSVRAIVEGDLFLSARSSFFFLLFPSFFFLLLSHPESSLKSKIFVGRNSVLGRAPGGGNEKNEKTRKTEKRKLK